MKTAKKLCNSFHSRLINSSMNLFHEVKNKINIYNIEYNEENHKKRINNNQYMLKSLQSNVMS